MADTNATENHTCPNCGYCPHCGRSNAPIRAVPYPVYPTYPWWTPPYYPYWQYIPTVTSGTVTICNNDYTSSGGSYAPYTVS